MKEKTMKARDLKRRINRIPDNADVFFGTDGDLSFYRVKQRGENLYQIEFNELYDISLDPARPQE